MTCQVHPSQHPQFHAALEAENQPLKPYDQRSAGHLVMPNGSMVSGADYAFLTAAAPYVLALHLAADQPADERYQGVDHQHDGAGEPPKRHEHDSDKEGYGNH